MEKILKKLKAGNPMTTRDFEVLGYGFEDFLRYCQVTDQRREEFHKKVIESIKQKS